MCIYETSMQLSIDIAMIIYFILKIIELGCRINPRMRKETNKTWPALMLNVGIDGITQLIPLVPVADGIRVCDLAHWRAYMRGGSPGDTQTYISEFQKSQQQVTCDMLRRNSSPHQE
jgi:hypothetical protein